MEELRKVGGVRAKEYAGLLGSRTWAGAREASLCFGAAARIGEELQPDPS